MLYLVGKGVESDIVSLVAISGSLQPRVRVCKGRCVEPVSTRSCACNVGTISEQNKQWATQTFTRQHLSDKISHTEQRNWSGGCRHAFVNTR